VNAKTAAEAIIVRGSVLGGKVSESAKKNIHSNLDFDFDFDFEKAFFFSHRLHNFFFNFLSSDTKEASPLFKKN
jgi:hypothetical protein